MASASQDNDSNGQYVTFSRRTDDSLLQHPFQELPQRLCRLVVGQAKFRVDGAVVLALGGEGPRRHSGVRIRADAFQEEASLGGPLRKILVLYNTAFSTQVSYSVACNGLHTIKSDVVAGS